MKALESELLTSIFESMYMQQEHEIEMQLWEYLDAQCSEEEHMRIGRFVENDVVWKTKFHELSMLHHSFGKGLEIEHPSLRFTQNVMEKVDKVQQVPAINTYLNKWIIRSIAAFFATVIITLLLSIPLLTSFEESNSMLSVFNFDKIKLPDIPFHALVYSFLLMNIIAGLLLLDTAFLRRQRSQYV